MATQMKEWTARVMEGKATPYQSWVQGIPLLLSSPPSVPAIDDARKFIKPGHGDEEKQQQTAKAEDGVLALRWSDARKKVLVVDILTGKIKAEWSPRGEERRRDAKAA